MPQSSPGLPGMGLGLKGRLRWVWGLGLVCFGLGVPEYRVVKLELNKQIILILDSTSTLIMACTS